MAIKNAIVRAKIAGVIEDIFVKTGVENVVLMENETEKTLATKLTEIAGLLAQKADSTAVTSEISTAIDNLINGAPGTYDTLKEIADYIEAHEDVVTSLNAAIGNKVDKVDGKGLSANDFTDELKSKVESLGKLASKNTVAESDLDSALAAKINTAASGNHNHDNKTVLDGITAVKVTAWDGAVTNSHTHDNKTVLDGINASKVSNWDAAQANVIETIAVNGAVQSVTSKKVDISMPVIYAQTTEPAALKEGDLWFQIIEA